MTALSSHPQRNSLRLQLRQNLVLQGMTPAQWAELEPLLAIARAVESALNSPE